MGRARCDASRGDAMDAPARASSREERRRWRLLALALVASSLVASVWLQLPMPVAGAVIIMSGISWTRHHENIGRLLTGQESRIGKK